MELTPLWTKQVKIIQKARNPLGLSRLSQYITSELLPGITTQTVRARNYIFYCWAIKQLKNYDIKTFKEFNKNITRLETAYVIGSLLDIYDNFVNAKGPIGKIKGARIIKNIPESNLINVNSSLLENRGGGYAQYYRNPIFLLNLTNYREGKLQLSVDGAKLADYYEKNIKHTKYFSQNLTSLDIHKSVLKEYGKIANFLRLKEFHNERDKLCKLLLERNKNDTKIELPSSIIQYSRKYTFLLILELYDLFTQKHLNFTDDDFRNIVYYNMTQKQNNYISFKTKIKEIHGLMIQWKYFQLQDYLTFSLENILIAFIEGLKIQGEKGMSFEVFFDTYKNFYKYMDEYLKIDSTNKSLQGIIQDLFKINGIDDAYSDDSLMKFDKIVTIKSKFSEFNIKKEFRQILNEKDIKINLAYSVLLLLITYLRFRNFQNSKYQSTKWIFKNNSNDYLSFITLEREIENNLLSKSVLEFFRFLLYVVINQHNQIATIKLKSRNNTFRFHYREDFKKFYFRRRYSSERTSDKFNTIKEIYDDLGIIKKKEDKYEITEYGKKILRTYGHG